MRVQFSLHGVFNCMCLVDQGSLSTDHELASQTHHQMPTFSTAVVAVFFRADINENMKKTAA